MKKLFVILFLSLLVFNPLQAKNISLSKDLGIGVKAKVSSVSHKKKYGFKKVKAEDSYPVRAGEMSMRFEVRPGDCGKSKGGYSDCKNDAERYELMISPVRSGEYWYAWSIYFPKEHKHFSARGWLVASQFHQDHTNGKDDFPMFMFWDHVGGYWLCIDYRMGNPSKLVKRSYGSKYNVLQLLSEKEVLGKWNDIIVNVNWTDKKDKGFFKVWVNGELKLTHSGKTKMKGSTPYWKWGLYRGGFKEDLIPKNLYKTQVIYYDELRKTKKTCEKLELEQIGYKCVNGNEIQKIK